ncbi:MAG: glycosyl transferase, partial [Candidatus Cloacimonetes bacterium]|nr:glycosyl transferase [Candidatus Cloacimonadota bacterium]
MKIAFLGPGWPWRGGIAQFLTLMAEQVEVEHQVKIFSFIKQYPKLIFPGKDQINRSKNKSNLPTESVLIPYNPFTWEKTEKKIRDWQPDILVVKYWIPFFAPAFGYIIRKYKKQSCGKVVYVIHNITFHEKWAFADKLSRYALGKA